MVPVTTTQIWYTHKKIDTQKKNKNTYMYTKHIHVHIKKVSKWKPRRRHSGIYITCNFKSGTNCFHFPHLHTHTSRIYISWFYGIFRATLKKERKRCFGNGKRSESGLLPKKLGNNYIHNSPPPQLTHSLDVGFCKWTETYLAWKKELKLSTNKHSVVEITKKRGTDILE